MAEQAATARPDETSNGSPPVRRGARAARTPAQRAASGKAARSRASRSEQAAWQPPCTRADPVDILREQEATRVPELVPIRHGRMLVSPFTFFRAALPQ
jgi:hypothetical protein